MGLWRELDRRLERGQKVLLAVVGEASRHSPGTAGVTLWIAEDGTRQGTVGGGAMELDLLRRAHDILQGESPFFEIRELHHRRPSEGESFEPSGMICAGRQTNVLYLLRPASDAAAVAELALLEGKLGEESSGAEDPGGWILDARGPRPANGATVPGTRLRELPDGGRRLEQGFAPRRPVAVIGAGHCGRALADLLRGIGCAARLWDVRPDLVAELVDAGFDARAVASFEDAGAEIEHPRRTPVVVMTPNVPGDVRALAGALRREVPFLGAMGSRAKLDEIFRRLKVLGFSPNDLERITAPVGLAIGSRTPGEIAVSVAAQLLSLRPGWGPPDSVSVGE